MAARGRLPSPGAYNPATEFVLGDYGVDTVNDRVWAVIDHNSSFGVGESTAVLPEPSSAALLAFGASARSLEGIAGAKANTISHNYCD